MPTYIVKLNEVTVDLYNKLNPKYPRLKPGLKGAIVFKVNTEHSGLDACYVPFINNKQKKRLMDSLEESHLNKINQVRLENLLEE